MVGKISLVFATWKVGIGGFFFFYQLKFENGALSVPPWWFFTGKIYGCLRNWYVLRNKIE